MSAQLCRPRDHDIFGEDLAPLSVLSARAPKVQPPLAGPRDDCTNEKFRSRYGKSEVFGQDRGRRHFQAPECATDWSPTRGGSLARAGSVVRSGANSPSVVTERTSPRATPAKPMDLFSAPPGTWTPLKRNTSRAPSPTGYMSPSVASVQDQSPAFDLVSQAVQRLGNSSPPRAGSVPVPGSSGRRSPRSPGIRPGLPNHNYLPPARQVFPDLPPQAPPAPSQQKSGNVGDVLQPKATDTNQQIQKPRIMRRRDSNTSDETSKLIRCDFERPHSIACPPGVSEFGIKPRGRGSSPRHIASATVPWALDDGGGNLADVARNCMQEKGLQFEDYGRVGARPNTKAQSARKTIPVSRAPATEVAGNAATRGSFGVRSATAREDNGAPPRGGRSDKASPVRADQESSLRGTAALVNFVAEVTNENKSGRANVAQPTPKLCEGGRIAWQEPVKSEKVFRAVFR